MFQFFKHKKNKKEGFTLVELLVSIGLFVIVLTFSLGSVISVLDAGRKARSIQAVMTNLNFTLEVMAREIKFGTHYYCGEENASQFSTYPDPPTNNCSGGSNAISFVSNDGLSTIYKWDNSSISPSYRQILKSTDGGSSYIGVTAPEILITNLNFIVFGSLPQSIGPVDNAQPRVSIVISGYAGSKPSVQTSFTIENTVSQRKLDL